MRIDPNHSFFATHTDWYYYEDGVGYVPTEKAPPEGVKAMKEYNAYHFTFGKKKTSQKAD